MQTTETLIPQLQDIVGVTGLLQGEDVRSRPNLPMGRGECPALAIARPGTTEEVSRILRLCHQHEQCVVTHGGLTGLVMGTQCSTKDLVVSTERMRQIERLDSENGIMVVQAGTPLETVQEAALEAGWMFPVDLGARGSATIGGMIATNAGGNNVVRYGMMREQVMGLEAVLADGTVVSSMNEVLKNNTGYDLKQLFIGAEGTLGVVTRAVLRLQPLPASKQTAFVAVQEFDHLSILLKRLKQAFDGKLSAFEVLWNSYYRLLMNQAERKHQEFLSQDYAYYVLLEQEGSSRDEEHFTAVLAQLMEEGLLVDAVICQSVDQAEKLWQMRDDVEVISTNLAPSTLYDVSLPMQATNTYVEQLERDLAKFAPDAKLVTFGHLGDGNIHLAVGPAESSDEIKHLVYENLKQVSGSSVSAEHGIGLQKQAYLGHSRSAEEIAMMRTIKRALDPKNLLNPGKILPELE